MLEAYEHTNAHTHTTAGFPMAKFMVKIHVKNYTHAARVNSTECDDVDERGEEKLFVDSDGNLLPLFLPSFFFGSIHPFHILYFITK